MNPMEIKTDPRIVRIVQGYNELLWHHWRSKQNNALKLARLGSAFKDGKPRIKGGKEHALHQVRMKLYETLLGVSVSSTKELDDEQLGILEEYIQLGAPMITVVADSIDAFEPLDQAVEESMLEAGLDTQEQPDVE